MKVIEIISILACTIASYAQFNLIPKTNKLVLDCAKTIISQLPYQHITIMYNIVHHDLSIVDDFVKNLTSRGIYLDDVLSKDNVDSKLSFTNKFNKGSFVIMLMDTFRYSFFCRSYNKYMIIYLGDNLSASITDLVNIIETQNLRYITLNYKTIVLNNAGEVFRGKEEQYCTDFKDLSLMFDCNNLNVNQIRRIYEEYKVNCELKVLYAKNSPFVVDIADSHLPGIEVQIMNDAARLQNMTINYKFSNHMTMMLKDEDLVIGGLPLSEGVMYMNTYPTYFKIINYHLQNDVYLLTWLADKQPGWIGMINAFQTDFWIILLFTVIAFMFITFAIANMARHPEGYDNISYSCMQYFGILLSQSIRQAEGTLIRTLYLSFALFALIISSAYTGTFVSLIVKSKREKQPYLTFEECVAVKLPVTYRYGSVDSYFMHEFYSLSNEVSTSHIIYSCKSSCVEDVINYRNAAHVTTQIYMKTHYRNLLGSVYKLYAMPSYTIIGSKVSDIVGPIEDVIEKVRESGLIQKWLSDMEVRHDFVEETFIMISMDHVLLIFYIYIVGVIMSVLVFYGEMIIPML